jgi:tetratricopeptide (TPR) repeat protein
VAALRVHLRRPIVVIGLLAFAALLILATARRDDAQAEGQVVRIGPPTAAAPAVTTQALIESGSRALELGRYDEAIIQFRSVLNRDPDSAVAYNLLGMAHRLRYNALRARKDKEKEIESFWEAVRLDPNFVSALVNLGTALWWDGRGNEAAPIFHRALALEPSHPDRDQIAVMIAAVSTPAAPGGEAAPTATPSDQPSESAADGE